jgi:hypothetical protein
MSKHQLYASGERAVDARLTINDSGSIEEEEITNVGAPAPVTETYNCECGAHFDEYEDAAQHILELRD